MEMTLNLPYNYVEIEEEEMMYLDGGVHTVYEGWGSWYVHFTKNDCANIAYYSMMVAGAAATITGLLSKAGAIKFAALSGLVSLIGGIGGWFFRKGANGGKGMRVYFKAWSFMNWYKVL